MTTLVLNHYDCFLIKFGNGGEIAQNSRGQLRNLFDHLFGHEDEDGLESLRITPCHFDGTPCQINEDDSLTWFNSELELVEETE
jgi:hypothetical protein